MNLTLHLKKEYFLEIKHGHKTEEYRLITPYWQKRLKNRKYDKIIFCLGYPKSNDIHRRIISEWKGYTKKTISHSLFGDIPVEVYAIKICIS